MNILEIIDKKKEKKELTEEEISYFIKNYTNDNIPDYQASALLMAIVLNGMSLDETTLLTKYMMLSGKVIDLSSINGIKLDKHSTGGIGDKVSLVLGPIIASCGGIFAKMSGRGLGHTGGTIDKLESISGFNCFLSDDEFKNILKKSNIAIIGQTEDLVPADKKIYALRDVTGTVNSMPLIASSIMSKKLATGSDAILLDVKCGSGAFMKNEKDATELAEWMISIGKKLNKDVRVEITNMEQPLGRMIGNKNEIIEAIECLKGQGDKRFMDLIYSSAITMLSQAKISNSKSKSIELINKAINSGKALDKFFEFISNQGGDSELIKKEKWWNPKYKLEIKSKETGYLNISNSIVFGLVSLKLGAGRKTKADIIDNEAGIELKKISGDFVKKDDILFVLYSSKEIDKNLELEILSCISFTKEKLESQLIINQLK